MNSSIKAKSWILKSFLINLMSRLPYNEHLHFILQKAFGKHKLDGEEMLRRALELFRLLRHVGGSTQEATVLDIGTGWFPFIPILASLLGARKVITVDIHPWLKLNNIQSTIKAIGRYIDLLSYKVEISKEDILEKYDLLKYVSSKAKSFDDFFPLLGIQYLYNFDITKSEFEGRSIDLVFSSNVLEHIPPDTLLNCVYARLLGFCGKMVLLCTASTLETTMHLSLIRQ